MAGAHSPSLCPCMSPTHKAPLQPPVPMSSTAKGHHLSAGARSEQAWPLDLLASDPLCDPNTSSHGATFCHLWKVRAWTRIVFVTSSPQKHCTSWGRHTASGPSWTHGSGALGVGVPQSLFTLPGGSRVEPITPGDFCAGGQDGAAGSQPLPSALSTGLATGSPWAQVLPSCQPAAGGQCTCPIKTQLTMA